MYIDNNKNLGSIYFSINSKLQLLFTPIIKLAKIFYFLGSFLTDLKNIFIQINVNPS